MVKTKAFGSSWIRQKLVRNHFVSKVPQHYGQEKGQVTTALKQALKAGVIRKAEAGQYISQIQLSPGYY
jgi:hypothetical protein